MSYADYTRNRPDPEHYDRCVECGSKDIGAYGTSAGPLCPECWEERKAAKARRESPCPTCDGSGEVTESHESYAVETLGCPHCMGSGKRGQS